MSGNNQPCGVDMQAPGHELYARVRAGFVAKGSSLNQWCKANGVEHRSARMVLIGAWNGNKSRVLRAEIIKNVEIS